MVTSGRSGGPEDYDRLGPGLRLVEREEAEQQARLEAIRADLARRAGQTSIAVEEMDARLADWRAERDAGVDLA